MTKNLRVPDWSHLSTGILWESPRVLQADDGVNGLEMARLYKPEIILCDVRMPRMTGIAMLERLEKFLPDSIPIFMSGYSDKEYLKAAIKLKAINTSKSLCIPRKYRRQFWKRRLFTNKSSAPIVAKRSILRKSLPGWHNSWLFHLPITTKLQISVWNWGSRSFLRTAWIYLCDRKA